MKTIINKILNRRGLFIAKKTDYLHIESVKLKLLGFSSEMVYLSKKYRLNALPNSLPLSLSEAIVELIGTSPYEGLSILNALYKTKNVKGEICEFGIAQGATSRLLGAFILEAELKKNLFLIDSFEGLSVPTKDDELKDDIFNLGTMDKYSGSMAFDKNLALSKLKKINFPDNQIQIIPGFIQDTIGSKAYPNSVSFAYVDFDLYEPIKIALEYLHKVTISGAKIIVDDYDFFSTGAKKASDEFLALHSSDYSIEIPPKTLGHFCILTRI